MSWLKKETLNIYVNSQCCFISKIKVQAELKGLVQKVVNAQRKSSRAALRGFCCFGDGDISVSSALNLAQTWNYLPLDFTFPLI